MDGRLMIRHGVILGMIGLLLLLGAAPALSHPGRLGRDGCHVVTKQWKSRDGQRIYKKGTRHCHRVSDAVKLGRDDIRVTEEEAPAKAKR